MAEIVGVIAAFTGVISFVGQSIDGIVKLRQFFRDAHSSPKRIRLLLHDFSDLLASLEKVRGLLKKLQIVASNDPTVLEEIEMGAVDQEIRKCKKDIETWVQVAEHHDLKSSTGIHGFFNRLRIAASQDEIAEFRDRITIHISKMSVNISILNGFLNCVSCEKLDGMTTKFEKLAETHVDLSAKITQGYCELGKSQLEALNQRFEGFERSIVSSFEDQFDRLSRSLGGLDSSGQSQEGLSSDQERENRGNISQGAPVVFKRLIEGIAESEMIASGGESSIASQTANQVRWCCDAVSGIDAAFVRSDLTISTVRERCIYCWDYPYEKGSGRETDLDLVDDSWSRGNHLVSRHSYGQCNLTLEYDTWDEMREHLEVFHCADPNRLRKRDFLHDDHMKAGHSRDIRSAGQYSRPAYESGSEHLLIETKMVSLLTEYRLWPSSTKPFRPRDRLMMASVLETLYLNLFDIHGRVRELAAVLRQAACLEEELMVTCGQLLPFCWSAAADCQQMNKIIMKDTSLDTRTVSLHHQGQLRWICTQPSQYAIGPSLVQCRSCEEGTRYMSKEAALWHLKMDHPMVENRDHWVQKTGSRLPRTANELIIPQVLPNPNSRGSRINIWLLGIFIESNHVRTVLRCDAILKNPSKSRRRRRDEQLEAKGITSTEGWAIPIIKHWFSDETNTSNRMSLDDHQLHLSSGAVDSRAMSEIYETTRRYSRRSRIVETTEEVMIQTAHMKTR